MAKCQSGTSLEHGETENSPEHPWKLEDFLEFEFLVLLCELFLGRDVAASAVVLVAVFVEEPEDCRRSVGEQVHEHGCPEDPGEVAGVLGRLVSLVWENVCNIRTDLSDDVGCGFSDEAANLLLMSSGLKIEAGSQTFPMASSKANVDANPLLGANHEENILY